MGILNYLREIAYNGFSGYRYYNSGRFCNSTELWTTRFLKSRNIKANLFHPVNITSVFGKAIYCKTDRRGLNVFYTGENIHTEMYADYETILQAHKFDLCLGFDYYGGPNYIRFPYWILEEFEPESTYKDIRKRVEEISNPIIGKKDRFCCLISRHDNNGLRGRIADAMSEFGKIDFGGDFRNNTDELIKFCSDDKIRFMGRYRFNICPENSNAEGYVTEKLFDSFRSGCIPVYWGSNNNPEPGLINPKAVIFWDTADNGASAMKRISELADPDKYREFISVPRLAPDAAKTVWNHFTELEEFFSNSGRISGWQRPRP